MSLNRVAGMLCLVALVAGGLFGVDRWNKENKARAGGAGVQTAATEPSKTGPSTPKTTVHFQVDPGANPMTVPPPVPMEKVETEPPLVSTGELEKKLKKSLEDLQKVLPSATEESTPPPGAKQDTEATLPLPPPPTLESKVPETSDSKITPPVPPINPAPPTTVGTPPVGIAPPTIIDSQVKPAANFEPIPTPPAASTTPVTSSPPVVTTPPVTATPQSAVTPPTSATTQAVPTPTAATSQPTDGYPKLPPVPRTINVEPSKELSIPGAPPSTERIPTGARTIINKNQSDPMAVRNVIATVTSQDDLQRRLADIEIKYLKDTVAELERRIQQMPGGSDERRKLEQDHQRVSDRMTRMIKIAEMSIARRDDALGKGGPVESPWIMNLETVDGKTVLQAMVHRKARFKVVCDRVDLQTPHGTLLAVGHVQLSGEGFQGSCERLSIPLADDRLILEGGAEVGVRTQSSTLIDERREGAPPAIEARRAEMTTSVPILHLRGDHLDLRWSDLAPTPTTTTGARTEGAGNVELKSISELSPTIRATAGPMVKVAFTSPANERWSDWGVLKRTGQERDGKPLYMIQDHESRPVAFVTMPAGMSLHDYVGKRVSVFGRPVREEGRPAMTFLASHVAWE